jgi:AraC-like DNA-binding protein
VQILVRLAETQVRRLRDALGPRHLMVVARTWAEAAALAGSRPISGLVADPSMDSIDAIDAMLAFRRTFPGIPVVLYTGVSAVAMHAITAMARSGLADVLISGIDDDDENIRRRILAHTVDGLSGELARRLGAEATRLPPMLSRTLIDALTRPYRFVNVNDLVAASTIPRRTLDRLLREAGLPSARTLLALSRLAKALTLVRQPGCTIAAIAQIVGYSSVRSLNRDAESMLGSRPAEWRRGKQTRAAEDMVASLLLGGIGASGRLDRGDEPSVA